ncbi:MAG: Enoyl-CoA hydratase, partial [uncultured Thermomicrobiales bacterium]
CRSSRRSTASAPGWAASWRSPATSGWRCRGRVSAIPSRASGC